jgi:hypothetical protein
VKLIWSEVYIFVEEVEDEEEEDDAEAVWKSTS